MNKICVYTCITGNYDNLKDVIKEKGIDYYCFTNNKNLKSDSWKIIYIEDNNISNVKLARKIKILGHKILENYDVLLWIDAAVSFKRKINDFINHYLSENDDFVAFKHGERSTIRDEAYECVKLGKEKKENVIKILDFYDKEKYPDDNGLIESTVFIRRKSKDVYETMKLWYNMIVKYSHRDQLSFNYCIYKTGLNVKWINEKVFDNEWFNWTKHITERKIVDYRLYFGKFDSYILDNDFHGKYKIKNNHFIIDTNVLSDTSELVIAPCHVSSTLLKDFTLNGDHVKYKTLNIIDYKDDLLFFDDNPFIIVNKKFKKGDRIIIDFVFEVLEEESITEVVNFLCRNVILKAQAENMELKNEIKGLIDELNIVYGSRSWKIIQKVRNVLIKK